MRPKPTGEGKFKCAKEAMIEAKVVPSMIGNKIFIKYIINYRLIQHACCIIAGGRLGRGTLHQGDNGRLEDME